MINATVNNCIAPYCKYARCMGMPYNVGCSHRVFLLEVPKGENYKVRPHHKNSVGVTLFAERRLNKSGDRSTGK